MNLGGLTGKPDTISPATLSTDDPSARNGATLGMMPHWEPINICVGGTKAIRDYAERIIPANQLKTTTRTTAAFFMR